MTHDHVSSSQTLIQPLLPPPRKILRRDWSSKEKPCKRAWAKRKRWWERWGISITTMGEVLNCRKPTRNILQTNNLPHQLIDKKGRQGEHKETLSAILSLIINTFLEMIWNVLLDYMKFMKFLAKRWNFKEDVFFVTFMPPWR